MSEDSADRNHDSHRASKRRRMQREAPIRLGWPTAGGGAAATAAVDEEPRRRVTFVKSTRNDTSQQQQLLWMDKHVPIKSADLCVAPKKVKEIAQWMTRNDAASSRLLILVGGPGIGKSTAVRVLAAEAKRGLLEWNESVSVAYSKGPSSWTDRRSSGIMAHESPVVSFESFLQQSGVGYRSILEKKDSASGSDTTNKSIILLEEFPHLHSDEANHRFRELMTRHIHESQIPTIMIWSDVVEGKHRPEDLEKLIDRTTLYSPLVSIVQIHPPTQTRMKRVLRSIIHREGLPSVGSDFYEDIYARSTGDLRFAISTLQFEGALAANTKRRIDRKRPDRDEKLNTFHALGKLLYAKRISDPAPSYPSHLESWGDGRSALDFDPERVVEHSQIELTGALSFLEFNCLDFFTDSIDLSGAMGLYSDATFLLDRHFESRKVDAVFPHSYVGSLAGRAAARYNRHPAVTRFRQFTASKMFQVMRKRNANRAHIHRVQQSLSVSSHLSLASMFGKTDSFSSDFLPYLRKILPGAALDGMQSYFGVAANGRIGDDDVEALVREQEDILRDDDIADFGSDEDDEVVVDAGQRGPWPTAVSFSETP